MSDIDILANLISNILQPNNEALRKQSEKTLVELRNNKPNELIGAFISILDSQYPTQLRNFSASQIRLCLSNFSPSSYTNVWASLTSATQDLIKVKLFQTIYKEKQHSMQKHIADTLGQVAGSLISTESNSWPEFKKHVYTLFQDSNISSNLAAFYILESFFTFSPEFFKDDTNNLYALFKNAFCHENQKLKLAALKSFSSFLEVLETKKHKQFEDIIIPLYEAIYSLLSINGNEQGLQVLSEMIEIEPKFFKKKFKQLNSLLQKLFEIKDLQSGVKRMATQMLVDYAEKYPALYRKNKDILTDVIKMVFHHMVDIQDQIQEDWKCPAEGYNEDMEDDQDFQTTRFGMGAIDRLIYSVGEEEVMPILSETIQTLLVQPDWRYKYTAVMALSQIGEYIDEPEKISSVLQMIVGFMKDQNSMLRYAACHAIGQISDDMQPKFQQIYGLNLLPMLVNLLKDTVPRVVSHSAAALTNFLQGMKWEQIQKSLPQMMNLLLGHISNGISLVKESCLSAISSVVQVAKENFAPYLEHTVGLMFDFFKNEKYYNKNYKQLKGQSIESLTIIAISVGGEMFKPAAQKLIDLMINLQQSQFEQTDPQKTYILAGWQRLCLVYGQQLGSYLDKILPSLFILVEKAVNDQLKIFQSDVQKKQDEDINSVNTFETQEAQVAISMLNVFIEKLKELYAPYVQKTVHLLCSIIQDHPNDDVKQEACKCLPNLISASKNTNKEVAIQLARHFMATLVTTIEKEFDTEITIIELQTLKDVIEELDLSFLSQNQVKEFSQKMLHLLKNSDEKKTTSKKIALDEDVDEEQKQIIGEQIKQQEEVQVAISELIGILFKTHKNMTIELAKFLITNVLPSAFKEGQSEIMNKFGIFLIDDMVEFLGYEILQTEWFGFANTLAKFAHQKSCVLRQAACYGLGIFAENTPAGVMSAEALQGYLTHLIQAAQIPKGVQKEKSYGHCKDNAVAAAGKFIKNHSEAVDLSNYVMAWFKFLPLKHDKPEAIIQHQLLCDIALSKDTLILGVTEESRLQNVVLVLGLFGNLLSNSKIYNDSIKKKIKQFLRKINNEPLFRSNIEAIWATLNEKQRNNLVTLANS